MAGGKLTPRQKMINLMYLVFIAMLALNMSKEVLTAFGNFNDKFDESNSLTGKSNEKLLSALNTKANDEPAKYAEPARMAKEVAKISKEFVDFLETVKTEVKGDFKEDPETGKLPFEAMDKSTIDEKWFAGDGYSARGTEIVSKIDKYVADIKKVLGNDVSYKSFIEQIEKKFSTADIVNREKVKVKFLDYKCKGFPAVSTLTFLTAMQNDVKNTEAGAFNLFLGNSLEEAASMRNFQAMVVLDKNVYFQGEQVKGKVVLGKYDANTVPTSFRGPGKIENGQAVISETAGSIGEHPLKGIFTFKEKGADVPIPFEGQYVVVPRPKSATISADKMNVVYRGVVNPMTISFAGVSDKDVTASAPGLTKGSAVGKYNMSPGAGREVTINVNAKLPDGKSVSDKKVFRIKGIPGPSGTVRGEYAAKGPKSSLEISSVGAKLEDFDFEVGLNVTGFTIKVPGQPTVVVSGNKMDGRAKAAINKASRGDVIIISNIQTKLVGAGNYMLPKTAPCTFEVQ